MQPLAGSPGGSPEKSPLFRQYQIAAAKDPRGQGTVELRQFLFLVSTAVVPLLR
jgi:hypothetical protein